MSLDLPPRRIRVIQLRYIADVLVTTPAVRALRRARYDLIIDFQHKLRRRGRHSMQRPAAQRVVGRTMRRAFYRPPVRRPFYPA
jgi:cell division inhibitor SulA